MGSWDGFGCAVNGPVPFESHEMWEADAEPECHCTGKGLHLAFKVPPKGSLTGPVTGMYSKVFSTITAAF